MGCASSVSCSIASSKRIKSFEKVEKVKSPDVKQGSTQPIKAKRAKIRCMKGVVSRINSTSVGLGGISPQFFALKSHISRSPVSRVRARSQKVFVVPKKTISMLRCSPSKLRGASSKRKLPPLKNKIFSSSVTRKHVSSPFIHKNNKLKKPFWLNGQMIKPFQLGKKYKEKSVEKIKLEIQKPIVKKPKPFVLDSEICTSSTSSSSDSQFSSSTSSSSTSSSYQTRQAIQRSFTPNPTKGNRGIIKFQSIAKILIKDINKKSTQARNSPLLRMRPVSPKVSASPIHSLKNSAYHFSQKTESFVLDQSFGTNSSRYISNSKGPSTPQHSQHYMPRRKRSNHYKKSNFCRNDSALFERLKKGFRTSVPANQIKSQKMIQKFIHPRNQKRATLIPNTGNINFSQQLRQSLMTKAKGKSRFDPTSRILFKKKINSEFSEFKIPSHSLAEFPQLFSPQIKREGANKYQILEVLGRGMYSIVKKAKQLDSGDFYVRK